MTTLRQYTSPFIASQITGYNQGDFSLQVLNRAESMVDSVCGNFINSDWEQANINIVNISASIVEDTVTLDFDSLVDIVDNYFQFCVIEVLSGEKRGYIMPVISSLSQILTVDNSEGLNGENKLKIYQLGKFPRMTDVSGVFKSIPREIAEASSIQAQYLIDNDTQDNPIFNNSPFKSESIGQNYSYTLNDSRSHYDKAKLQMHPRAIEILSNASFTKTTL